MAWISSQLRQNKYCKIKKEEVLLGGTVEATIESVSKILKKTHF